jgi:hypothetical protein
MVSLPPGLFEVESMAATGRTVPLRSGSESAKEEARLEDDAVGSLHRMWSYGVPRCALAKGKSSYTQSRFCSHIHGLTRNGIVGVSR